MHTNISNVHIPAVIMDFAKRSPVDFAAVSYAHDLDAQDGLFNDVDNPIIPNSKTKCMLGSP